MGASRAWLCQDQVAQGKSLRYSDCLMRKAEARKGKVWGGFRWAGPARGVRSATGRVKFATIADEGAVQHVAVRTRNPGGLAK